MDPTAPPPFASANPAMNALWTIVGRVGPTQIAVLLTGESGTGKEVLARHLHAHSLRQGGPLVAVNCSAIPANLIESELFGHVKGAFTGAHHTRAGLVEQANGGTFFLDEIGEIPLDMQVKLLRLLESSEYRMVGDNQTRQADIRVISATNRDLTLMVKNGSFRADLFHRLHGMRLHLPTLEERREDIPQLFSACLDRFTDQLGREGLTPSHSVLAHLMAQSWPGNIRELANCARYVAALANGPMVELDDLPVQLKTPGRRLPMPSEPVLPTHIPYKEAKRLWMDRFEDVWFSRLIEEHKGNASAAARAAGISRKSIQRWLERRKSQA
jgi:DNA-binding NtrC family response regulator